MKKTSLFQLPLFLSLALSLVFLSTTSCEKESFATEAVTDTPTLTSTVQDAERSEAEIENDETPTLTSTVQDAEYSEAEIENDEPPTLTSAVQDAEYSEAEIESGSKPELTNTIQAAEYSEDNDFLKEGNAVEAPFSFLVTQTTCIEAGKTYEVQVNQPERYAFVWTVDDLHAGHSRVSPSCICSGTVTIYVTRLHDGVTLSRTFELPSCESDSE
jgi:hypothetical protein